MGEASNELSGFSLGELKLCSRPEEIRAEEVRAWLGPKGGGNQEERRRGEWGGGGKTLRDGNLPILHAPKCWAVLCVCESN